MLDTILNAISNLINPILSNFVGWIEGVWEAFNVSHYAPWQIVLDILIVSVFFYAILKWARGTRAIRIMAGLAMVGIIFLISRILDLRATASLLNSFLAMMIVAIPVMFQPELRRAMEHLGHSRFFAQEAVGGFSAINHIVRSVEILSNKKQGALIVIEGSTPLGEYIETGITLNAEISRELLLNIFFDRAPLHDGAVIVRGNKVVAAGCVLPICEKKLEGHLGTRHRSAIGLSEATDATTVVVSEERGTISIAHEGKLKGNINIEELEKTLRPLFTTDQIKKK